MKYGYAISRIREYFALSGVMHINHQCDWLGRQLFQFHGQCHISLPYNLRERFNGNESWSLSEFNASQVWTWGSRMWNVVTLPGLTNSSAVNAHWPIDINLLLWSLSIALPVENVLERQHTKWHMLINIHAGRNAGNDITLAMWLQVESTDRIEYGRGWVNLSAAWTKQSDFHAKLLFTPVSGYKCQSMKI